MPFTVVPDKANLSQFTEADWDTYIRDNANWLHNRHGRVWDFVKVTANVALPLLAISPANAGVMIQGAVRSYDNTPKMILVQTVGTTGTGGAISWGLWRDSTPLWFRSWTPTNFYFIDESPSAGSYAYSVRAVAPNSNSMIAGAGGSGEPPATMLIVGAHNAYEAG
jgi:hypothetical protein